MSRLLLRCAALGWVGAHRADGRPRRRRGLALRRCGWRRGTGGRWGSRRRCRTRSRGCRSADDLALDNKKWYVVDAEGLRLGRMASEVAKILLGKHKASYTPGATMGDFVVITNCEGDRHRQERPRRSWSTPSVCPSSTTTCTPGPPRLLHPPQGG